MPKNDEPPAYVQPAEEKNVTRSDRAATQRAFHDLQKQVKKLEESVAHEVATATSCDYAQFQSAWEKRQKLNQVKTDLTQMQTKLAAIMPQPSKSHLNDKERQEIRGLYASGLYTQQQLADQYGIKHQSTISDVVKGTD